MIDIVEYIYQLIASLKTRFSSRLVYVGLQGSYLRGEATENSDIDIMVVLDGLSVSDLAVYREVIQSLEYTDLSCGFICSKKDLRNWNPLEICHLLNTTKDYFGELRSLVPAYSTQDIRNFIKMSVGNLYHEICHRYIHSDMSSNMARLSDTYKGTFFVLQNIYYLKQGQYIATKAELLQLLTGKDRDVLSHAIGYSSGVQYDFRESFDLLFDWCQETLAETGKSF